MTYRNKTILTLARECPRCTSCLRTNDGTIVAAHSNQIRDGKGMAEKASDYRVAYLCSECHMEIDASPTLSRVERIEKWEAAHRNTIGWLFESGHLTVEKAA